MQFLTKKEMETGVPDRLVASVYNDVYRILPGALAPDKLVNSTEQMRVFRRLLGKYQLVYGTALLDKLGAQIIRLRKRKLISFRKGQSKLGKGYKEKAFAVFKQALREEGVNEVVAHRVVSKARRLLEK